ncbi:alkaline phosphatase D family protein [Thermomonospora echinospora]|nr:alkaline phosphatase D family protein [Thermomonospora echinospora]
MTELVLGPLLRHVGERTATVWVETDRPCTVEVLGASSPTFTVHGHHYALVEIDGLEPGSQTPYQVLLDGQVAWPEPGERSLPDSVIHTRRDGGPVRLAFGSCRRSPDPRGEHGPDALSAYAHRLAEGSGQWPTALLMIGDQVYADELGEEIREFIRRRRGTDSEPVDELADFEEYTYLYRLAWRTDPAVRWLLSTVPTYTIFDDHDVRDDWNTSYTWREQMWALPWWRRRITGGLGSYWIYQHLGNMSPEERAADELYARVRAADGDAGEIVDEFAERADKEPDKARWSYTRDFGGTRLVMVDSRCARLLTPDRRAMLDDAEHQWLREQCRGGVDHLLLASSLPYLLPRAIHNAENWNEAMAGGAWGRAGARLGEKVRQAADLEHWAAFDASFRSVAGDVLAVARQERGPAPASIAFLSGDVHYSYLARVTAPDSGATPISQVVCSPLRNPLQGRFRLANVLACRRGMAWAFRGLAALARVPKPPLRWRLTRGPWFDNMIATIEVDGRTSRVRWEAAADGTTLTERGTADLSA